MSLDDIKAINWRNPDPRVWPNYLKLAFGVAAIGVLVILVAFFM